MPANTEPTSTTIAMDQVSPSSISDTIRVPDTQRTINPLPSELRFTAMSSRIASRSFEPSNPTIAEHNEYPATPVSVGLENSPAQRPNFFRRTLSRVSALSLAAVSPITLNPGDHFVSYVANTSMSRRQVAEIQFYGILNDPQGSLPIYSRSTNVMSVNEIAKQLNTPPFIIERLLNVINSLSNRNNSSLTSERNVINLTRVLNSTLDVRILLFFMMLDENSDNLLMKNEMTQWFQLYLQSIRIDSDILQEAVRTLVERFFSDEETQIGFEEFSSIVTRDDTILQAFSGFAVNPTWFIVPPSNPESNAGQPCCANLSWYSTCYDRQKSKFTPKYFNDHLSYVILLILFILVNLGLALYVIIYQSTVEKKGVFSIFARTGGMLLNFNCTFVIVLMLKQTILYIRSKKWLRRCIPVDDHIDSHKSVGRFIAVLAIIHTVAHMINFSKTPDHSCATFVFTTTPKIGWVGGFASISGVILCVILAIIVIFSMNRIRYKGHSRIFYWTHRLYPVFFIFLFFHAENFWKWSIGPLVWLSLEKLYSIYSRTSSRNGRTYLNSVTIEQSDVISLNIHRPDNFKFKPGDYINIHLPQIAFHEFHPFTISSAPEEKDILRVHIQASGYWTKRVYKHYADMSVNNDPNEDRIKVYRADQDAEQAASEQRNDQDIIEYERRQNNVDSGTVTKNKKEVVIINGPYSSCARYIFDCEHVVLISGGIGVTPYASILSSLMAQFRASRKVCQYCQRTNYERDIVLQKYRIRKVDFIWVSRDYKSFEWFLNLLKQFEQEQEAYLEAHPNEQRFLTIHLYFTMLKTDDYIGYSPLQLIAQVCAQVTGTDMFTGLRAQTHIGRPDWDKIFNELRSDENASTANNVNVFFCGPSVMGETIQGCCINHKFRYYEEKF